MLDATIVDLIYSVRNLDSLVPHKQPEHEDYESLAKFYAERMALIRQRLDITLRKAAAVDDLDG
jgi:hypothetical protein